MMSGAFRCGIAAAVLVGLMCALTLYASPTKIQDDVGYATQPFSRSESPRIVSLAPSVTEIIYSLGLGERLVGDTIFCDYPSKALDLPKVGDLKTVNLEVLKNLNPDIVIASADGNDERSILEIQKLGISTFTVNPTSLETILDSIEKLGVLFSRRSEAREVNAAIRKDYGVLRQTILKSKRNPRLVFLLSLAPHIAVSKGSYLDDVITKAGARNLIAVSTRYPRVSLEQIVSLKPDFVFVSGEHIGDGEFDAFKSLLEKSAACQVIKVSQNSFSRPGPRIVESIALLADSLRAFE